MEEKFDLEALLKKALEVTKQGKMTWQLESETIFRAKLKAAELTISGEHEPTSLRHEICKDWTTSVADGFTTLISVLFKPATILLVPEGQSKVEWPVRRLTLEKAGKVLCTTVIDRENSAYHEISELLLRARLIAQEKSTGETFDQLRFELDELLGDDDGEQGGADQPATALDSQAE